MYAQLGEAAALVFTFNNLIGAAVGITVGFIFGTIPGLTGNVAIGLLVPFTFYLDPLVGIVTLLAIGKGTSFGGSIPAILFNYRYRKWGFFYKDSESFLTNPKLPFGAQALGYIAAGTAHEWITPLFFNQDIAVLNVMIGSVFCLKYNYSF